MKSQQHPTTLLDLPETVLHEINSWCPSAGTAAQLHNTCHTLRRLRHDPAAAALLLLRCPCSDHWEAFHSYGHSPACNTPLAQQVMQLLGASPASSRRLSAPSELLSVLLTWASSSGRAATVRALMSLPQPPDLRSGGGVALQATLGRDPQQTVLRALLECGADPCGLPYFGLFRDVASNPAELPALQLLLQYCPRSAVGKATLIAQGVAAVENNVQAAEWLLEQADLGGTNELRNPAAWAEGTAAAAHMAQLAVATGSLEVVQLILDRYAAAASQVNTWLIFAVSFGHAGCATLLLDRGADVDYLEGQPLLRAVEPNPRLLGPSGEVAKWQVLHLLLQRGAAVTLAASVAAHTAGRADIVALLMQHAGGGN